MLCRYPMRHGVEEWPCGKCIPCRVNRRRLWTARLVLEQQKHERSSFVTLTYDAEHLPKDGCVSVREAQLFLKRLRKEVAPAPVRYYIVGEYGERSKRPHYHAVLFGLGPEDEAVVRKAWGKGHVLCLPLQTAGCAYVVSYVMKRMTAKSDPRLEGLAPEFARMSLRPGIGASAAEDIADGLTTERGSRVLAKMGDVPGCIRFEEKRWPLGRYLRRKIRGLCGMDERGDDGVKAVRMWITAQELREPGAFAKLEANRVTVERRAKFFDDVDKGKKGRGI